MHLITINISNDKLLNKDIWLLEQFKKDDLEIVSKEDIRMSSVLHSKLR